MHALMSATSHGYPMQDAPLPLAQRMPQGGTRTVRIDAATFEWLRTFQLSAPAPRLDLRYHVEGILQALIDRDDLRPEWIRGATNALRESLSQNAAHMESDRTPADIGSGHQSVAPIGTDRQTAADTGGGHSSSAAMETARCAANEGAKAQGTDGHVLRRRQQGGARALHVSETAYLNLRRVQAMTLTPRLDFVYLIHGARSVVTRHQEMLPDLITSARLAMRVHLDQLTTSPSSQEIPR